MNLIRELLEDSTAGMTCANNIASYREPVFKKRTKKKTFTKVIQRSMPKSFAEMLIMEDDFDAKDVISKLSNSQASHERYKGTTIFGMQDSDGNIIKVYVNSSQAKQFEEELNKVLGEFKDEKEIAEILYDLKSAFDIKHIDWPEEAFEEDEEQTIEPGSDVDADDKKQDDDQSIDTETPDETDVVGDINPMDEPEKADDESDIKSLLTQVIQMLKSDAEVRKAEAEAKKKEADAKEAEWTAKAIENKVKSSEEIAAMEDYYKKQKAEQKEADTIAKMAKYRYETSQDSTTDEWKED